MRRLPRALLTLLAVLTLCACGDKAQDGLNGENATVAWDALSFDKTMPLDYATQFSVSFAGDDYKRITIGQDQEFLLVTEGAAVPSGVPEGVTVLPGWTRSTASASVDARSRTGISSRRRRP